MKLAWIVYREEGDTPEIHFDDPRHGWSCFFKVIQIVYAEIEAPSE